ncbi:hypothetical protein Pcinc_033969 [Petrolisthes cinctipes]|uniref:Uncharacterized protein n=1 Tax=Petrolisthes cinctipes TaxID=88211 RepID=A0AAE1ER44_PETCI|nr:hypothetical protein Pcinc_033969 [Petrolisthes cinctipes]
MTERWPILVSESRWRGIMESSVGHSPDIPSAFSFSHLHVLPRDPQYISSSIITYSASLSLSHPQSRQSPPSLPPSSPSLTLPSSPTSLPPASSTSFPLASQTSPPPASPPPPFPFFSPYFSPSFSTSFSGLHII